MNPKRIEADKSYVGKCSTFGGPSDKGMKPTEGVALYQPGDHDPLELFMPGGAGLGRKLNPDALYCACRWPADIRSRMLRSDYVVEVAKVGQRGKVEVAPVDWGPAEWTGRIIDLSPGAAEAIGVKTDDEVQIILRKRSAI